MRGGRYEGPASIKALSGRYEGPAAKPAGRGASSSKIENKHILKNKNKQTCCVGGRRLELLLPPRRPRRRQPWLATTSGRWR
jgi:hypothetical protein